MEQPTYYAIMPATVRYNKNLTFLDKFIYAELTALSNTNGYSTARNEYFAELYNKTTETIGRSIKKLERLKFIKIEYEKSGFIIENRKIFISDTIDKNINGTVDKNINGTVDKNVNGRIIEDNASNITREIILQDKRIKRKAITQMAVAILNTFNDKCGTKFRDIDINLNPIINRINDGYKFSELINVIDKKYNDWHDTEFCKFLRPETIFGKKFESYLNEKPFVQKQQSEYPTRLKIQNYSDDELIRSYNNNLDDVVI